MDFGRGWNYMALWLRTKRQAKSGSAADAEAANRPRSGTGEAGGAANGPLLWTRGVVRSFQVGGSPLHVLKGIDMELPRERLIMLRGRSGSGKTTLLNLIGGLDTPTKGEIVFQSQRFHEMGDDARTNVRRQDIGFIFQAYALLPLLSAYEN